MRTIFISVIAALLLAALPVAAQKAPQNATQFYMEYHDAWVKAKSMDTLLPYMDKTSRGQYDATPKEQRGPMFQMMKGMGGQLTNVKVAKAPLAIPLKVLLMVGVILTSTVVYLAIASVVTKLLNS